MVVQPNSLRKLIQRKRQLNEKDNISGWANCDRDTANKITQFASKGGIINGVIYKMAKTIKKI